MPKLSEEQELLAITRKHKMRVERRLALVLKVKNPHCVYEPIHYALGTGGKRVRAILTLLACEAVGGNPNVALDAAASIELLHNFTLIHDDVMDNAALRRGKPTVYKKWDSNTAILAGDVLAAHPGLLHR
jgi:geranylgeranyl diphosphate synthase type II